ncbi:hypothetical protein RN001_001211 [Aquatica leii]|uniref:RRM domain-containing protein n=1 Tax=Aquatica leii TaxID=1421715 RepID=A0AAN7SSL2_9COLE|nr:hypothetical protein RN001_001211 [Aquatica leii]
MTESGNREPWSHYAKYYDPVKIGSIDGTDSIPHDKAILRANNSEYVPNRHVKGHPECTIFIGRLSPKTTKETIKEIFSKFGQIQYETEHAAEEAYRKANKLFVDGQAIFVDFECERLLKGWKPRRLGGGFGGRKESGQLRFGGRDRPFRRPISLKSLPADSEKHNSERCERDYYRSHHCGRSSSSTSRKRSTSNREFSHEKYNSDTSSYSKRESHERDIEINTISDKSQHL